MEASLAPEERTIAGVDKDRTAYAIAVYILYLLGFLAGVTAVIGVVIAYSFQRSAPSWLATHFQFQIRTFWIGLLVLVVGLALHPIGLRELAIGLWGIWLIVRVALGFKDVLDRRPIPRPESWLFGR